MTLALIPAKRHSEGVPDKNWKPITPDRLSCVDLAVVCGLNTCDNVILSSDWLQGVADVGLYRPVQRPLELCRPDTPMLDVVKHALEQVPGPDDEIIVLLQPTSPLRSVETVKRAIELLESDRYADSVVSVSPSYPLAWSLRTSASGYLIGPDGDAYLGNLPTRRQGCRPTFKRDGVVYVFRRGTVVTGGSLSGELALPLHTPPAESLSIDTPEDWEEAVRRLRKTPGSAGTSSP